MKQIIQLSSRKTNRAWLTASQIRQLDVFSLVQPEVYKKKKKIVQNSNVSLHIIQIDI